VSNNCPVCNNKSSKARCERCGFETPTFDFLSEDDADKWYRETVLPYWTNWENREKEQNAATKQKANKKALVLIGIVLAVCFIIWLIFPSTVTDNANGGSGTASIIYVQGKNLTEKFRWLQTNQQSNNNYFLELSSNQTITSQHLSYGDSKNITVNLRGVGKNRTIRISGNDAMFIIYSGVTLVLDNITLRGRRRNRGSMVSVQSGGTFILNAGSAIINNTATASNLYGTGVWVGTNGTFTMNGGTISGNTVSSGGGGVAVWGTFTMNDGTISGNSADWGGGVYIGPNGTFTMSGGAISGNSAKSYGGGVYVDEKGSFTKTGGTITGYDRDRSYGNVVKNDFGHAVFVKVSSNTYLYKNTTAGLSVNLSYNGRTGNYSGAWNN